MNNLEGAAGSDVNLHFSLLLLSYSFIGECQLSKNRPLTALESPLKLLNDKTLLEFLNLLINRLKKIKFELQSNSLRLNYWISR